MMTVELSTDQLRRLHEDGKIRIFQDSGEDFLEIVADDLDVSLSELAGGTPAKTPSGIQVLY